MNHHKTKKLKAYLIFSLVILSPQLTLSTEVSITMDDPNIESAPLLSPEIRNERILASLDQTRLKAALFVCGMRVDSAKGKELLNLWNDKGHIIANHSFSHLYFNSENVSYDQYAKDFVDNEGIIKTFSGFTPIYRFPFLKEGDTTEKRDKMRALLQKRGYRNGHVTIDASDWYVDLRLSARLRKDPKANTTPYRDYYLKHIWDRAIFYNELAKKVLGREIKHTLLIHHNLLNALYLSDLIGMFKQKGWKMIDAADAFKDPVFAKEPAIVPAGEALIWGLAKETGKFEDELRYPAEDGEYQKEEMDRLGL